MQYEELRRIQDESQEIDIRFGHYIDYVLVLSDKIVTAGRELFDVINRLDVEPQWVPAAWLSAPSASSAFTEAAQHPPMCSDASPAQHRELVKQQRVPEVLVEQVQCVNPETNQSAHDTAASVASTTAL